MTTTDDPLTGTPRAPIVHRGPIERRTDLRLTTHDGETLVADAWHPAGPGRWPVLVQRLPYGRSVASSIVLPHPEWFVRRGFAVVIQDVRGTGASTGTFDPFAQEVSDGVQTLDWVSQLDFSDGRTAMYGFSYQGLTQLTVAAQRPESLRAIAPMMCSGRLDEGWFYWGGVPRWRFIASWSAQLRGLARRLPTDPADLSAIPATSAVVGGAPWFEHWANEPPGSAYWDRLQPELSAVAVPAIVVGGLYDTHSKGTWDLARALDAHVVFGPWTHRPWGTAGLPDDGSRSDPHAGPGRAHESVAAFFRAVFDGEPVGLPRAQIYSLGGGWRTFHELPDSTGQTDWHLAGSGGANSRHGDGRLDRSSDPERLPDALVAEPMVPHPGDDDGARDQAPAEDRRDVLCYTSALLEGVELVGTPRATVTVECDRPTFDVIMAVTKVSRDGASVPLCHGARRVVAEPDQPVDVTVEFGPMASRFAAGDRLRVTISAHKFPLYGRNPHSEPWAEADTDGYLQATLRVHEGLVELPGSSLPIHSS